ncbi:MULTISPECIES: aminotransferase class I/II-fold pyridoxal phosphate-dependent enzyme [Ramlibacter]|uniref:Aminotransferase class I/II-fold pyridoxal phosphate-dependent enzyme n=1 Tax=Ramlibacter aquaticus TaxID=2780094 RepID=A0ABR9SHE8_9BURK|nr:MULTISPECIES: aminotransferase class I/II-fold pyridoxal phosphate-dependent enzyme [Ramlibacter]MBE7941784.1 aminotransferase class I/II-fold pyridoxal phosphate-dependent enzyme [Ramlibacter aquaticus]
MKSPAQRVALVDTPIIPTIAALARANPGTISLGQGVVSYGPPDEAVARLPALMADPQLHKYQGVMGIAPLLEAIAAKLAAENGIATAGESHIMVTAGSNMAFLNAVLAVADPGEEFILPMPFYFNQEMAVRLCGCVPVPVPTRADWSLDVDAIAAAITPRTRAIVTVSPNNPTGAVYAEEDLRAVNALCARHGLYHFSDEAYEYFTYGEARHFSPAAIPGAQAHTLSFFSLSKNFGMASWRVGYVVFPHALFDAMNKVQDTNLICAPVPSQLLAVEALRLGRAWVQPRVDALAQVRTAVHQALGALEGLAQFPRTAGAFYVLMRLPGVEDPMAFNRAMVERHHVATIPGFAFGLADTRSANYQRLSYGALDPASVAEGVQRYVAAVKDWYRA